MGRPQSNAGSSSLRSMVQIVEAAGVPPVRRASSRNDGRPAQIRYSRSMTASPGVRLERIRIQVESRSVDDKAGDGHALEGRVSTADPWVSDATEINGYELIRP